MKHELYLTKIKRGYDFNWNYSDKTGSTTPAHPPGDPGTRGDISSVALTDGDRRSSQRDESQDDPFLLSHPAGPGSPTWSFCPERTGEVCQDLH